MLFILTLKNFTNTHVSFLHTHTNTNTHTLTLSHILLDQQRRLELIHNNWHSPPRFACSDPSPSSPTGVAPHGEHSVLSRQGVSEIAEVPPGAAAARPEGATVRVVAPYV